MPPTVRQEPVDGADQAHSGEYLAVRKYMFGCADRLAPILARVRAPKRMRELLREGMQVMCEELERVEIV